MKLSANSGMLILGIWLLMVGALPLLNIDFAARPTVLNVLAIAAGALIIMNK
jgi:hypothetical protein